MWVTWLDTVGLVAICAIAVAAIIVWRVRVWLDRWAALMIASFPELLQLSQDEQPDRRGLSQRHSLFAQ
jgi:hypothetical protein